MTGWSWAALALYTVWLATAFGARAVIQHRRTGDAGFRGLSGRPGSVSWWAGALFVVALLGGIAAPVGTLAGMPVIVEDAPTVHRAGAGIAVLGVVGTLMAQRAMGSSWRVGVDEDERTALVTDGPFARVRNPIFTAMIVTALGLAAMVPNFLAVGSFIVLITAVELQVRVVEEPYLQTTHGVDYSAYGARAGRFVPGVGRLTGAASDNHQ